MQAEPRFKRREPTPFRRLRKDTTSFSTAQRGEAGHARVLCDRLRRVPKCHDRVADEFVDCSTGFLLNDSSHYIEVTSERGSELVRRQLLGESCEVSDVGEHDRNLHQLAAQHRFGLVPVKTANEIYRNVLTHRAHRCLGFLETLENVAHITECRCGWCR